METRHRWYTVLAINPIFGSQLPDLASALGSPTGSQASTSAPTVLTPEQLSAEAADVLLSDLNANSASLSGDSLMSFLDPSSTATFGPLTGASSPASGDPLLNDLNAMDAGTPANSSTTSMDATLNQNLNAFLMQQATASFQASQAMDNQTPGATPGGNVLGNTKA